MARDIPFFEMFAELQLSSGLRLKLAGAVLTGVEARSSSPVRINRDPETLRSLNVNGLYPCGEGAGYAGGILSAAVDGLKCAEALIRNTEEEA